MKELIAASLRADKFIAAYLVIFYCADFVWSHFIGPWISKKRLNPFVFRKQVSWTFGGRINWFEALCFYPSYWLSQTFLDHQYTLEWTARRARGLTDLLAIFTVIYNLCLAYFWISGVGSWLGGYFGRWF